MVPARRETSAAPDGAAPDGDDWDDHWATFGDPALGNPANDLRNRLILDLLGTPKPGATILDIGSGQGQFGILLQSTFPHTHVVGLEYSHEGVRRATQAAKDAGVPARFVQRDLLQPQWSAFGSDNVPLASLAVCSEVLEHVDHPEVLLRNAAVYLAPGCRLVVTVPGGPMSALDRHIGHRTHYKPSTLKTLLERSGFVVERAERAGFPFFNLYRLIIVARGKQLIEDVKATSTQSPSKLQTGTTWFFNRAFRWNVPRSRFGWQIVAVARPQSAPRPERS